MASRREGFVKINGVHTKVVTYGGWIEDANPLPDNRVIICVPGNPGVTAYYNSFLSTLYEKTKTPCWIISHGGHEIPLRSRENIEDNHHNYNVEGQTKHKIAFIEQYVPRDVKITLIGHSIGAKIILNILKTSRVETQIECGYLLFPTIERMAVTPNGKFLLGFVKPWLSLIVFASWFFSILPMVLKKLLISLYLIFSGNSTNMSGATVRLVRPKVLRNVFYMAMDEMDVVVDPDMETLSRNAERLVLYYARGDNWAPVEYSLALKKAVPALDIRVCEKGYSHAFVLNSAVPVGLMVSEWMSDSERGRGPN